MTKREGLRYEKQKEDEAMVVRVFTDASFAPDGAESHGCVIVKLGSSVISWKSSKQSLISLSTERLSCWRWWKAWPWESPRLCWLRRSQEI